MVILVPTDFSENAFHALNYAVEINRHLNGNIVIFHAYEAPQYAGEVTFDIPSAAELKQASLNSMQALLERASRMYPGIHFQTSLAEGMTVGSIISMAEKLKAGLVVMGTTGASGLKEILLGTQTELVTRDCTIPVMAIPARAKLKIPHRVIYATGFRESDQAHLKWLLGLLKPFGSEIILLHVADDERNKTNDYARLFDFMEGLKNQNADTNLNFKLLEGDDAVHDLNLYAEEVQADLLVLNKRDRPFFKRLVSRSITKRLVYHTHVPLLVVHDQQER